MVTREDLAEQSVDDLLDIGEIDEETAAKLIMTARKIWFDDENANKVEAYRWRQNLVVDKKTAQNVRKRRTVKQFAEEIGVKADRLLQSI